MSEINCYGDEVIYREVIPGWSLVQLVNLAINKNDLPIVDRTRDYWVNGNVMGEGHYGLTHKDDSSFIFAMPPMLQPKEFFNERKTYFTKEAEMYYEVLGHYYERLSTYVDVGYRFYLDCVAFGYNPEHNPCRESLAKWLLPKIYRSWKEGKVLTWPYGSGDAIIHQSY